MRLLQKIEGSVLWLLASNDSVSANLRRAAQRLGVDPARLIFAPRVEFAEHLARQHLADLFLDTLPYNAGATANAALWSGLPLVTGIGDSFVGRMAASMLEVVGLSELVAANIEDYEELAMRLASDAPLLASIRMKLDRNKRTHPLFETGRFCRHIEAAYTNMWEIWQRGETPRSFSVEPVSPN
jgi:predicted O-linked N-acetylglucosamine transferase (SPINDLY family)